MSVVMDPKRYPRSEALRVAQELQAILKPACRRIAIVGSLRRHKHLVKDIELLFVPVMTERPLDLLSTEQVSVANEICDKLLKDGVLAKRPNINGQFAWGEANKLAIHVASGIPVDLFATSEPAWWVSLVIRTGSKENNLRLTTGAQRQGASLMAYGTGVRWSDGTITEAKSEEDVFRLCKVPYLKPDKR